MENKGWRWGLLGVLLFLGWFLTQRIGSPWTEDVDFNGAVWSQAAHNLLQAGLAQTAGVPAVFYFGPLPIPANGFYGHHPALLHLELAGLFHCLGEHEWVARSLPIACSLLSVVLLWLLVNQCAGARAATLSAAIFATLPMELHYGSMVNFEPCTLMWMLLGLLGLRHWESTGHKGWRAVMVAGFALAMFTAWLGYFLVLLLCIQFAFIPRTGHRALALILLTIAALSGLLFLWQIRQVRPEAWADLGSAFQLRIGQKLSNGAGFTFYEWANRVGNSLLRHIPVVAWLLAASGAVWAGRSNREGLAWLNRASLCFLLISTFYVVVFRNASYIHEYASFYFIAPVAILGGVGLEGVAEWLERRERFVKFGSAVALAVVLVAGWSGYQGANRLNGQAYVLQTGTAEPAHLAAELGKLIQREFSPHTRVLCNFATIYCPQLCFYSQRLLINGLISAADWKEVLSQQSPAPGGIIWTGAPEAKQILALLPHGSRREVRIGGIPFCVWNGRRS